MEFLWWISSIVGINDPDYILEGRITNFTAINSEKKNSPDANSVEITINCSFIKKCNEFPGLIYFLTNHILKELIG
jgi:hypothetical protein